MRIGAKQTEQAYQRINPELRPIKRQAETKRRNIDNKEPAFTRTKTIRKATDVLSDQELQTLHTLFQSDQMFKFYGQTKVHQVQAGVFLDIKG